jgi:Fe-S cluster assembly iron-binding protein IscA
LFIHGHYERNKIEATGNFECPSCDSSQLYSLVRRWEIMHIYFIPLCKTKLIQEWIECGRCRSSFSITVLAGSTKERPSSFEPDRAPPLAFADSFRNVVEFTDVAMQEIKRRIIQGKFGADVVVRVEPLERMPKEVKITFDYALADGDDLIGKSHGLPVVVDRRVAAALDGWTIDYGNEVFFLT